MIKVSILGATGYTGQELVRLLSGHPQVEIVGLGSRSYAGKNYGQVYPHLGDKVNLICRAMTDPFLIEGAEVIFLALPHGLSAPYVEKALVLNKKVIDLGADFRLQSPEVYQAWYKKQAPSVKLLEQAVYGLPEIYRQQIKQTNLVANPGCYPTTILLALYPLLKEKLVKPDIIIDSKSGISGAGRSLKKGSLYAESNENVKPYGFPAHRHLPEIEQELIKWYKEVRLTFTPHLVPLTRGMLSTIYLSTAVSLNKIQTVYQKYYKDEPFIKFYEDNYPEIKWVQGTNFCALGCSLEESKGRLIIISVIDNLIKGAAGQAVQNMNLMCGFSETIGLSAVALYP